MAGPIGLTLNPASGGATIGVDSDGTFDYEIVKIGFSTAGVTPVQASTSNPFPVNNYLQGTVASVNTGNADAGTQRVVLATNQPALTNALPVLQSGSWNVGQSGAWNVGQSGTWTVTVSNLPAAAALSDATANPTTAMVGGALMGWDATNSVWRRVQVDAATGTLKVDPGTVAVTGTFWQATQPISAASLPLPTGAATAAKQPALGTAGSASTDVLTVQGIASMVALKVDGSAVTQPVSLASLPALAAGSALIGSVKVSDGTNTASVRALAANALNVSIVDASGNQITSFGGSGGTALADAAAFTRGTTQETPVGGIAETAAPSLTTGHAAALSLNLSGGLRVDGSGVTQPVSGTVTANQGGAPWSVNQTQFNGNAVNLGTGNTGTGTLRVVLATDQPSLTNALPVSQSGSWSFSLSASLPAGTNAIGSVNVSPLSGQGWPSTYSGSIGATLTAVKASSAGTLGGWYIYNSNTSVAYVQIFDAATTGGVTLGTTAPKLSLGIPAGGAANVELTNGIKFASGIIIAVTTTRAGSTGPANTVDINLPYA